MAWFQRSKTNIEGTEQKEMPDGLWTKCPECKEVMYKTELEEHFFCCKSCSYHFRIGSKEYISIIIDEGTFAENFQSIKSSDPLEFTDSKHYSDRLVTMYNKTKLNEAVTTGTGSILGKEVSFACMNFNFIGGSMGAVVGEKFFRAAKLAIKQKLPFIMVSATGGARMQEAALSLMQMAKTSAVLAELGENGLPYISLLTDPTTGGVSASYGMLGDLNIAEPGALIGFAGPRVIEQTINKKLPKGFQSAEFVKEHGFLDKIVHRKNLKDTLKNMIDWFEN